MLEELEFKGDNFTNKTNFNELVDLTSNTIIICSDWNTMCNLSNEIMNTVNGHAEYNDYYCENTDIGKAKLVMNFALQRKININEQTITLTLEPAMIYSANTPEDIWFADTDDEGTYAIYALTSFMGYQDFWNCGKDYLYKM